MIREGRSEGWLKLPISSLPTWATFNGAAFNGIDVGPLPGYEYRGSTVVAKRDLIGGEEEPLMVVPRTLILSLERVQEHAKTDQVLRDVLEALGDYGRTARGAILTFLLMQATISCPDYKGTGAVKSPFAEYVKFLPDELLPTFWNDEEIGLLPGTTLYPATTSKLKSLYREYDKLRDATTNISWCQSYWWDELEGLISFEDWKQVDVMYRSRALEFPGIGDSMVPCVDMANHASGDRTVALYECDANGDGVLLLRDDKRVSQGEEVSITYGDAKGACEMVFSYGFIEDGMDSAKELFLDLDIPDDDPLKQAKIVSSSSAPGFRLFDKEQTTSWEGEYVWLICVNEEDGLDFAVLQTNDGKRELQVSWKENILNDTDKLRSLLEKEEMWDVYRLRALSLLQGRVEAQLRTLLQAEEAINTDHSDQTSSIRHGPRDLAEKLRKLEAELLEKAYNDFASQIEDLMDSETVRKYLQSASQEDDFS